MFWRCCRMFNVGFVTLFPLTCFHSVKYSLSTMGMSLKLYNILRGFGSLLVVFPAEDVMPKRPASARRLSVQDALRSDWETLGRDMNKAFETVSRVQR